MATEAKELLNEKGALSAQKPTRMSTGLQDTTKELVVQFFEDDKTSRAMPGKNDCETPISSKNVNDEYIAIILPSFQRK